MEVQSRTRSYESPKILATQFNIEQGFAQSPYGETGQAGKTVITEGYGEF